MFFGDWHAIWRIVIIGTLSYVALMAILRLSGKRTLSKMTAFDLVITVTLGSTLSSVITSKDVPLAEGITALAVLVGLQFVVTWMFVHFPSFENWAKSTPSLLVYRQTYQRAEMRKTRVTENDIMGALRSSGTQWDQAEAVVLEADGSLTVVPHSNSSPSTGILSTVYPKPFEDI